MLLFKSLFITYQHSRFCGGIGYNATLTSKIKNSWKNGKILLTCSQMSVKKKSRLKGNTFKSTPHERILVPLVISIHFECLQNCFSFFSFSYNLVFSLQSLFVFRVPALLSRFRVRASGLFGVYVNPQRYFRLFATFLDLLKTCQRVLSSVFLK